MAEASKIAKVGLLLGALGGIGFGIYYFAKKQRAQAGASQTSGQGTTQQGSTQQGGITSGAGMANIPSSGSCPTCGGGIPSAPSQPSQPSPSPPSTPGAPYPPPNISTLTKLISGQLTPTPPTPALQELLGRQGPQAPTPALQYLLGQAPAPGGITIGPIRILF
jgi:hypothetical protein